MCSWRNAWLLIFVFKILDFCSAWWLQHISCRCCKRPSDSDVSSPIPSSLWSGEEWTIITCHTSSFANGAALEPDYFFDPLWVTLALHQKTQRTGWPSWTTHAANLRYKLYLSPADENVFAKVAKSQFFRYQTIIWHSWDWSPSQKALLDRALFLYKVLHLWPVLLKRVVFFSFSLLSYFQILHPKSFKMMHRLLKFGDLSPDLATS